MTVYIDNIWLTYRKISTPNHDKAYIIGDNAIHSIGVQSAFILSPEVTDMLLLCLQLKIYMLN